MELNGLPAAGGGAEAAADQRTGGKPAADINGVIGRTGNDGVGEDGAAEAITCGVGAVIRHVAAAHHHRGGESEGAAAAVGQGAVGAADFHHRAVTILDFNLPGGAAAAAAIGGAVADAAVGAHTDVAGERGGVIDFAKGHAGNDVQAKSVGGGWCACYRGQQKGHGKAMPQARRAMGRQLFYCYHLRILAWGGRWMYRAKPTAALVSGRKKHNRDVSSCGTKTAPCEGKRGGGAYIWREAVVICWLTGCSNVTTHQNKEY